MSLTITDLAARFFTFMDGRNAPGTIGYYRLHVLRWIAAVGNLDVADVRKHHLLEWGKCWHSIQAVQRLFAWAHGDMELIERNPFKGIKKPPIIGRRRVLSAAETSRLLRGADATFRRVLVALRESIARPQEIRALAWECIRWTGAHTSALNAIAAGDAFFELIEFKSRKQRRDPNVTRRIVINARLGRLLKRMYVAGPCPGRLIFTNGNGEPWTSNAIRLRMRRLCKRCRIDADERGERVVAYTLRHTSATIACAEGIPDRVLAELMGHTSTRTTARYQHVNLDHLREAVNRLHQKRTDNRNV